MIGDMAYRGWRIVWTVLDACFLRWFDSDVDKLVRRVAQRLPDDGPQLS